MNSTEYYEYLTETWNFVPTKLKCNGYESVMPELARLTKALWDSATPTEKNKIEDEVFNIYRSINIVPIEYYSYEGCKQAIRSIAATKPKISNNTLSVGNREGQDLCRFWFPNMMTATVVGRLNADLKSRFYNDGNLRSAINLCFRYRGVSSVTASPSNIRTTLTLLGGGQIQNFKPLNGRAVFERIDPGFFGRVLDYSAGYGGRLLGATTSNLRLEYTGLEPNTETVIGLTALSELVNTEFGYKSQIIQTGSEVDLELDTNEFDAAFSSPPYFNLEKYSDEPTQCMVKFTTLEDWVEGFVIPTCKNLSRVLKPGAICGVNLANYHFKKHYYDIEAEWIKAKAATGFELINTMYIGLVRRPGAGQHKDTAPEKREPIYLFKNCKA